MGTRIGRYTIVNTIGTGGMATVFQCHDSVFDREVAVKVLHQHYLTDGKLRGRFEQEARIIAALEHHAIVPVYDFGEQDGQPYLVMRLMTGGSLKERIEFSPPSLEETENILTRICSALDRAHAHNIVHRDLKPGNILFDQDGMAYLADFGIARLTEATQTTSIVGSPNYMAPEQARGMSLDARTDVYQMGVVLFEMLTGMIPFAGETTDSVLYQHVHEPVPLLHEIAPYLPAEIDEIIARALAKPKEHRFSSASELAQRFSQALQQGARQEALALAEIFPPSKSEINRAQRAQVISQPTRVMAAANSAEPTAAGTTSFDTEENKTAPARKRRNRTLVWLLLLLMALAAAFYFYPEILSVTDFQDATTAVTAVPETIERQEEQAGESFITSTLTIASILPGYSATPTGESVFALDADDIAALGGGQGRIVYAADRGNGFDIYINAPNGASEIRLNDNPTEDFHPVWSPDGSKIAFHSHRGNWEIFVMNADGSNPTNLTNDRFDDSFPQWSPDGQRIVFHSNRAGKFNIYTIGVDGENLTQLTDNGTDNFGPAFSPDGSKIVYMQGSEGKRQIYVMNVDGSEPRPLTSGPFESLFPQYSPDGKLIAFHSNQDGAWNIHVMNANGTNIRALTHNDRREFYAAWSPNGKWVIFHADMGGGNRELWAVNVESTETRQFTISQTEERMPSWMP